ERTEKPEIEDEDEPVKIIAGQSGIIDKMQVLRGYALYKPGQTAVKDDVIIGGAVPSTFGKTKIIHAEGSVLARTWHEICAIMPLRYREKIYTGESHSRYALIVGRKRINFYSGSRIFRGNCDNIISKKNVGMKGLFELPVIIVREQSLEYEISDAEIPEDYAHKELEVLLRDELKQRIGSSGEIVSSEYTFCIAKGYAVGTLRAECRQDIAKEEKMSQDEINAAKSAEEEKNTE
ncbi:MAG: hypothetical protein GX488_03065, partial [Clostridiales bacterium]|nr:hypothetical protein [Clostridiales bacterium]